MEISEVKKRVLDAIEKAKRAAAGRRERVAEAEREFGIFLDRTAVPLFRQLAGALRAEGYPFTVFTPAAGVRLMSERSTNDYIELMLDTAGDEPLVMGRVSRARGSRVLQSERPVAAERGAVRNLEDEDVLQFVVKELVPFLER